MNRKVCIFTLLMILVTIPVFADWVSIAEISTWSRVDMSTMILYQRDKMGVSHPLCKIRIRGTAIRPESPFGFSQKYVGPGVEMVIDGVTCRIVEVTRLMFANGYFEPVDEELKKELTWGLKDNKIKLEQANEEVAELKQDIADIEKEIEKLKH